jgi:hypothetical protein
MEEINDLERMKLRIEEQEKETEDEVQMQALEQRLEELDIEIGKANAKQAMENPNFWDKVGQEDIDEGNEKKLRSPASEEISERGHEEQKAHPSKGEPGEGTEFRHEISAEMTTLQVGDSVEFMGVSYSGGIPNATGVVEEVDSDNGQVNIRDENGILGWVDVQEVQKIGSDFRFAEESAPPTLGGMPENVESKVDAGEAGAAKFALDENMFKSDEQVKMEENENAVADPSKETHFDKGGFQSSAPFVGPSAMPGQNM